MRTSPRWALRALALLSAGLMFLIPWASPASAHGSVLDPASRNYGCWARWGSDFQNPSMAQQDPMCWQAWQHDTNAMWNWNGLYRDNVANNHQAAVPNGQLCSAGRTGDGRYNSMDAVGAWRAANVSRTFTVHLRDQALHGAEYYRVYVTRQGFSPTTQSLGWNNLELLVQTGRYAPASDVRLNVNATGRTGRHIVYTIWRASHMDQTYYFCSDVNFT